MKMSLLPTSICRTRLLRLVLPGAFLSFIGFGMEQRHIKKQIVWGISATLSSWYTMMAVHEAGHCLGAILTGATVDTVVIPVVGFSRTDFSDGTSPLLVVWSGPLVGALAPTLLLIVLKWAGRRLKHSILFFVGFCLLANGAYIGLGAALRVGDCRQLLRYGSPMWLLILFGAISMACGLCAWHRMGPVRGWFAVAEPAEH